MPGTSQNSRTQNRGENVEGERFERQLKEDLKGEGSYPIKEPLFL